MPTKRSGTSLLSRKVFIASACIIIVFFQTAARAGYDYVHVSNENEDGMRLSVAFPEFATDYLHSAKSNTISLEGCTVLDNPGYPGVAAKGILVEVPQGCSISVSADSAEYRKIQDFSLAPAPKKSLREHNGGMTVELEYLIDNDAYGTDAFYPEQLAELVSTGYLRDRFVALIVLHPLQYNPSRRELRFHRHITVTLHYRNCAGSTCRSSDARKIAIGKPGPFDAVYRHALVNYSQQPLYTPTSPRHLRSAVKASSLSEIQASPFAAKVSVSGEGIYKISYENLTVLGADLSNTTHENIKMYNRGEEIALHTSGTGAFGSGDYILFYGEEFKSRYATENTYWLIQGGNDGKRMKEKAGEPVAGYETQQSFMNEYTAEEDTYYWINVPNPEEGDDRWFWDKFSIIEEPLSRDYTVTMNNVVTTAGAFSMTVELRGETNPSANPDHHTKVYVNGKLADDFTWNGRVKKTQVIESVPASYFVSGSNVVTVEAVDDLGVIIDSYYLDRFSISYYQSFTAEDNYLKFYSALEGGTGFAVEGFDESDISLFDVSEPYDVAVITGGQTSSSQSGYSVSFEDNASAAGEYIAAGSSAFQSPQRIVMDESSNLSSTRSSVDYIMITHDDFYDDIQELATYRRSKGLNVEVVLIQDVYDEFSYGIKDPAAIKSFLTHAYDSWHAADHPTYVALVGDASIDYRDVLGNSSLGNVDFIPTSTFETDIIGETPTDNWFACVNGPDYLPDLIIGRLCVKDAADVKNIIDKIIGYEAQSISAWNGNVILAADDEAMFENISDSLAESLPDGYSAKKIYMSEYENAASATDELISRIDSGAVFVNYTGHGHIDEWAAPFLFHTPDDSDRDGGSRNDVEKLSNSDRLTFVMVMNCLSGYFPHWKDRYSLAEEFVRSENRGAIACFAATSSGYPSEHQVLARQIFTHFFENRNNVVGSLVTAAKIDAYNQVFSRDILETFTLFGDPATELKLIDSSAFEDFGAIEPENLAVVERFPPQTFSWGIGLYERFKVQFSSDDSFPIETTITTPLFPLFFLQQGSYRPNILIWSFIRMMALQNTTVYWRVAAYDENFDQIGYTDSRSFTIQ